MLSPFPDPALAENPHTTVSKHTRTDDLIAASFPAPVI